MVGFVLIFNTQYVRPPSNRLVTSFLLFKLKRSKSQKSGSLGCGGENVSKGFQKGFQSVLKRFQKGFQSVLKGFPKSFKLSETGFPKGFTATSNPLENAFVDRTCFRMEGHIS